ncbi:MAG: 3-deoxy-manno-octulosonate cytidylyltransferase [Alphaproteobacteria bacterium]|nr:3-deoxy-manno-octulosonate cytidylyltransferase [Alphaproteobacteria bacterium]
MTIAIAIPARYASTRFPGKPLAKIGGISMLERVTRVAKEAASGIKDIRFFVTTEDERIAAHAGEIGVECVMTSESCPTGSDRVHEALEQLEDKPDFVINLQGDAPFTPVSVVRAMIKTFRDNPEAEVITPVHRLSWHDLDRLREAKKTTPFSGTTAILGKDNRALWFSKNIIPGIRKEESLRAESDISPVYQHMGLYGFRVDVLAKFCALPQGVYEQLEGLEQLRMLENGITVTAVPVEIEKGKMQSGIDTPEDLARAEKLLE